ncbi:DUF3267 domain-containing protein [Staphylococcus gallinarum]|jgi:hypothetical protein|uniref:DUF3267 domain-containing protein n=1 Tax=Staphylococcus gallinarum TaxID=1293 RepID=UPI000D1E2613|nr:DUF3267 domain-containing protein [Staphylococcus gallinarum]MCD8819809.1 DUF3267 domain-containing protein [Staphylococcus gallinarum]MCD8869991.1 DUF3267 domain-containing protein [Staphylococcus gallinarum]MCQ9287304.1 DUF3267 domain-containing protein [Staphylococcus gallinarum]MCW0985342.1 DUF3267 domain-containing protein [Staphylococcus gallinarum]MEB6241486.1 DUF3267 domain-containing protein [Staphylococcus gallinarum]
MYLCSRQIDINARFGLPRIAFLSIVTTIITFLIAYEILYFFSDTKLTDRYFIIFLIFVVFLYPIHKAIHLAFLFPYYKSFRKYKLIRGKYVPFYNTYVNTPVNKYYFCFDLITPVLVITPICAYISALFPQYGHYLMFIIALNMGYSVMDFLYLKIILFSNEGKFIEEHQTGINILNRVEMNQNLQ